MRQPRAVSVTPRGEATYAGRCADGLGVRVLLGPGESAGAALGSRRERPHPRNWRLDASGRSALEEHDLARPTRRRLLERGQRHEPQRRDGQPENKNHEGYDRAGLACGAARARTCNGNAAHVEYSRVRRRHLRNVGSMPTPALPRLGYATMLSSSSQASTAAAATRDESSAAPSRGRRSGVSRRRCPAKRLANLRPDRAGRR